MVNIMTYTVDLIDNDIIKLINDKDESIVYINKNSLNFDVKENDVLLFDGMNYVKDDNKRQEKIDRIRRKMESLKSK